MARSLLANQHEYSDRQLESLVAVNVFGAALSVIGAVFVISNYCAFSSLRQNFAFKLILMIAVSDFILAISNLMGAPDHGPACYVQAVLQEIGDISSLLWVVSVSWSINKLTLLAKLPTTHELDGWYTKMQIIIWSITIVFTLIPFTTSSYGPAAGWCWIKASKPVDIAWRYLLFYVPIWLSIIYMIVVYVNVYKRLNTTVDIPTDDEMGNEENSLKGNGNEAQNLQTVEIQQTNENEAGGGSSKSVVSIGEESLARIRANDRRVETKKNRTLQRMKFYPLVLIICYSFATIRRIIDWATEDQTPYFLAILHTFFAAIPGFLDAMVYGFTKDVKERDMLFLNQHCGCSCDVHDSSDHEIIKENESDE